MRAALLLIIGAALFANPSIAGETFGGRAEITDGDTITIEGREGRVRIHGIDAPEGAQRCEDAEGIAFRCGARSSDALASIIGSSARVQCEVTDIDRWKRIVALCRNDAGKDIASELVRQGWAIDYAKYSNGLYAAEELEARKASRGLWAGAFVRPEDYRRSRR